MKLQNYIQWLHWYNNNKVLQRLGRSLLRLLSIALFGVYIGMLTTLIISVLSDITVIPDLHESTAWWVNDWSTGFSFEIRVAALLFLGLYPKYIWSTLWRDWDDND